MDDSNYSLHFASLKEYVLVLDNSKVIGVYPTIKAAVAENDLLDFSKIGLVQPVYVDHGFVSDFLDTDGEI